ncbi:head GIN domain-containing protein [Gramella sp. AN32]|uniref:Head GIN domain-containing protein n=1 Tax=Christiangramia antarctica TaxID=2058158 RepID=A0ABW5X3W8_9FLAO|nr:head GIN domain-containing protein [Gramella sp. AN32]MCM4158021.1 DUF2807 domain-containing protein [Gramella sp. AN32]
MKKVMFILAAVFMISQTANAQWWGGNDKIKGNGEVVTKTRSVGSYNGVSLTGSFDVELVKGKEGSIKIEAESNLQEYITTEVKNGKLEISTEKNVSLQTTRSVKITVPVESIEEVSVTGSGDIYGGSTIRGEEMKLAVTGSGNLKLNLEVKEIEGKVTGSGDIDLKGKTSRLNCTVTGSGDFDARSLEASNVDARIMGSGDIFVNVTGTLEASIAGSGDIKYSGNPDKKVKTAGSGRVSSL